MFDLFKYYFNLPFWGVIAFGGKFLFLLFLISIATRTTHIIYRVRVRKPLKRWLNSPKNSGSLKMKQHGETK